MKKNAFIFIHSCIFRMLIIFKNISHKVSFIFCQVLQHRTVMQERIIITIITTITPQLYVCEMLAAGCCRPLWKPCLSHSLRSFIMPVQSQLTLWLVCLKSHKRGPQPGWPKRCGRRSRARTDAASGSKVVLDGLWVRWVKLRMCVKGNKTTCHVSLLSRGHTTAAKSQGLDILGFAAAWLIPLQEWIKEKIADDLDGVLRRSYQTRQKYV